MNYFVKLLQWHTGGLGHGADCLLNVEERYFEFLGVAELTVGQQLLNLLKHTFLLLLRPRTQHHGSLLIRTSGSNIVMMIVVMIITMIVMMIVVMTTCYTRCSGGRSCGRRCHLAGWSHQDKLFCHKLDTFAPSYVSQPELSASPPQLLSSLQ